MRTAPTDNIQLIAPFKPYAWQIKAWRDLSPILLLTGSAGGGKYRLAAEKLHGYCKRYAGAMALALRKTRESMTNSTVLFMERVIIGDDPAVRHFPSKNRFEYANGSILAYGGMKDEAQREQIRSIGQQGGLDIVWLEEANKFTETDFNEVLARMRGTAGPWRQVLLTTNPDSPTHWIYKRLIQNHEASAVYSTAANNPANPDEYLETLGKLTGVLGMRLREGRWIQAEGAVYATFDPQIHVLDWFEPPASWRRIRAIDFGYTHPFACQWWAIDEDGRMYLYREIYHTQRLVEDHAREILRLSAGERIEYTVADHDAEDRATLARHGIHTIPAKKDVSPGIQEVQSRLRVAGDRRPRIFVLRGALVETDPALEQAHLPTCSEEEFPMYIWPDTPMGRGREAPVKEHDHGMDAMRYACMSLMATPRRRYARGRGI